MSDEFNLLDTFAPVIVSPHFHVHTGDSYMVTRRASAVADAGTVEMLIQTGADNLHIGGILDGTGQARLQLFAETTVSSAGTAVSAHNKNQASAKITSAVFTHTPTVTSDGTRILDRILAAAGSINFALARNNTEIILAANTNYLFRVTNNSGASANYNVHLDYYET